MNQTKKNLPWPETVPILTTTDMCKHSSERRGACCLVEWGRRIFNPLDSVRRDKVFNELRYVIEEELGHSFEEMHVRLGIACFNDRKDVPLQLLADVWNRAMFLLGYTQGNPCKKPLSKAKRNAKRS